MNKTIEDQAKVNRIKLEDSIKQISRYRLVGYAKAAAGIIAPLALVVGGAIVGVISNEIFGNEYSGIGAGLAGGIAASYRCEYVRYMRDTFKEIRYNSNMLKCYRAKLL